MVRPWLLHFAYQITQNNSCPLSRMTVHLQADEAMDDARLLLDFTATGSQSAFALIVRRHVDLVYACAQRHVHDAQLAEDITQAVFLLLARKAHSLRHEAVLAAWLLRATRYASLDAIKLRQRRRKHEMEAAEMIRSTDPERCAATDAARAELLGMLDAAMTRLGEADRRVLVLRFYEKRTFPEIGDALGTTEESARKRVQRSIERLRAVFTRGGSLVATGGMIAIVTAALGDCANAAPAGLATKASMSAASSGFAVNVAVAVARRMMFAQLKIVAFATCAGVTMCIVAGIFVHSLMMHHDNTRSGPLPQGIEEHDHPG
jgi:RNA polymerase sigma factor (sigma-70 family)